MKSNEPSEKDILNTVCINGPGANASLSSAVSKSTVANSTVANSTVAKSTVAKSTVASCEPMACDPNSCSDVACRDGLGSEGQHHLMTDLHQQSATLATNSKSHSLSSIESRKKTIPMLPLSSGVPGDRYSVVRLCSNHLSIQDDDLKRRLQMYGVVPGTELVIDRIAPLGDPITLRVRGTELALRRREAACIIVSPYSAVTGLRSDLKVQADVSTLQDRVANL